MLHDLKILFSQACTSGIGLAPPQFKPEIRNPRHRENSSSNVFLSSCTSRFWYCLKSTFQTWGTCMCVCWYYLSPRFFSRTKHVHNSSDRVKQSCKYRKHDSRDRKYKIENRSTKQQWQRTEKMKLPWVNLSRRPQNCPKSNSWDIPKSRLENCCEARLHL